MELKKKERKKGRKKERKKERKKGSIGRKYRKRRSELQERWN